MLGPDLHVTRGSNLCGGDDHHHRFFHARGSCRAHGRLSNNDKLRRAHSDVSSTRSKRPANRSGFFLEDELATSSAAAVAVPPPPASNLRQFIDSVTPSVPVHYLPKTTMSGWSTDDESEYNPYFLLGDVWESFREWSAYGVGVPLVLNDNDYVVQYYVPYLSGIQLYGDSAAMLAKARRPGEDTDSDFRDSSSDGSSDYEPGMYNQDHLLNGFAGRMNRLSLRDASDAQVEDFSSDDSESMNIQGHLMFEYLERDPPYSREPLANKILDLAFRFPELKALRSCDLLSSSWISVAWYPIYRIPTGPTLKDLDACFLTYHSLHTAPRCSQNAAAPMVTDPSDMDGVSRPRMLLLVFGLASYKFKGSLWTPEGGPDLELADSLMQDADNWLRSHHVDHPDFTFFCTR